MAKSTQAIRSLAVVPANSWMRDSACYLRGRSFIDGTDEVARTMDAKWGIDRLRFLVSDKLREKFDRQRAKFLGAIANGEVADVERESLRMRTAWAVLDRTAASAGAEGVSTQTWEIALPDGSVAVIAKDVESARAVTNDGRLKQVFTLTEIANLIHAFPEVVKVKDAFPGATVVAAGPRTDPLDTFDEAFGDELPF